MTPTQTSALTPPPPIPFVKEITFEYGVVEQVSPLIRRIIANNPGPFTYTGTGVYIIGRGGGRAGGPAVSGRGGSGSRGRG